MNRRLVVFTLCNLLITVIGAAIVSAQGPKPDAPQASIGTGFTYQGLLQKSNLPLNDVCNMTFSLWDSQSNGTGQVGSSQVLTPVVVTTGVFSVILNSGSQFGPNAFDGSQRWLEVGVKCSGDGSTSILPRQQLTSVPYALQSLTVAPNSITTTMIADSAVSAAKLGPDVNLVPQPGSITTTMLANNAVTAAKLGPDVMFIPPDGSVTSRKLNAVHAYYYQSNQAFTSATTPGDLPDTPDVVTITLDVPQLVDVFYQATTANGTNGASFMTLAFDGQTDNTATTETLIESNSSIPSRTITGVYQKALTAGIHTIAAKYHAFNGTAAFWRRKILVFAISQ